MTERSRWIALIAVAAIALVSCARPGAAAANLKIADFYAAGPTVSDVRTLFGDPNWWQGPPMFGVRPLDAATTSRAQRFSLTQHYIHIGTNEQFLVAYTVFDTTTGATAFMTRIEGVFGTAQATNPKVGDQTFYYGEAGTGGAPYLTHTFVRLGEIVVELDWGRKDGVASTTQLARNANKVLDGLKKVLFAKSHPSPEGVDQTLLPPLGLDITFLGAARLPVESWLVMDNSALPTSALQDLQGEGVNDFLFADYALNRDTHMEVQAAVLTFSSANGAAAWAGNFSSAAPDPTTGIAGTYIDVIGEYHYFLVSGRHGAMLVCKSTSEGEAASRACEAPLGRTALAWKLALPG